MKLKYLILIFLFLSLTTLGYAALNSELTISGSISVTAPKEIIISSIKLNNLSDSAYEQYNSSFTNNSVTIHPSLPNNSSKLTYDITISNLTNNTYYIDDIRIVINKNDNIVWSIDSINKSTPLTNGNTTFQLEIFYDNNTSLNETSTIALEFIFKTDESYKDLILNGSDPIITSGMIPISISNLGVPSKADINSQWYDYQNRRWANVVLIKEDVRDYYLNASSGTVILESDIIAYLVWIPRFEYVIDSVNKNININFVSKFDLSNSDNYIIHPAFLNGSNNNFLNGEWDQEIDGFYISKYPAGYQANTVTQGSYFISTEISNAHDEIFYSDYNYTSESSKTTNPLGQDLSNNGYSNEFISFPVFKPITYIYNNINFSDIYVISQAIDSETTFYGLKDNEIDSHMVKNSEWGALAYLTYSSFGTNGIEPYINNYYTSNDPSFKTAITGVYSNSSYSAATTSITAVNPYKSTQGMYGSSTRNITGVFDMVGGATERVAGYITNGDTNIDKYLGVFASSTFNTNSYLNQSTKYVTVYPFLNGKNEDENFNYYKSLSESMYNYGYGDAILETANALIAWNDDISRYPAYSAFAMIRSPYYASSNKAGIFGHDVTNGAPWEWDGFRVIFTPIK